MASPPLGVYLASILSICCAISNVWSTDSNQEHDTVEELQQRIRRIELIQRDQHEEFLAQKQIIQEQARQMQQQARQIQEQNRQIESLKSLCEQDHTIDHIKENMDLNGDIDERPVSMEMYEDETDSDIDEVQTDGERKILLGESNHVANTSKPEIFEGQMLPKMARSEAGIQKRQESGISFTVYIDHDVDLGIQQTLKYNKIITNEGGGYNIHTGVFTCPMSGMYMFAFYIGERDHNGSGVKLVINSNNVVDAVVDTYHDRQDLQGGNLALKRLTKGDVVWIELQGGRHLEGNPTYRFTTFSGVMLYE